MDTKKSTNIDPVMMLGISAVILFIVNVLLFILVNNETKTLMLLRSELVVLNQDRNIIASSQELINAYSDEIDAISRVFPNENSIADFLSIVETELFNLGEGNTIRFGSLNPLPEGDKLFLLLTVTLKSDIEQLQQFLKTLETIPYLTHVTSISMKSDGIDAIGDISISLKIYVQNPFKS